MVHGECGLCGLFRPLCDSHLLPRAVYLVLRSSKEPKPDPVFIYDERHGHTSRQLKIPLLCEKCETRFRTGGEDWVLANYSRADGSFRLRDVLKAVEPIYSHDDFALYSTDKVQEIDREALIYFAASIFWRAAVRTWKLLPYSSGIHITLGPYEKPLRRYLLHELPFPDNMAIYVRIWSYDKLMALASPPEGHAEQG